MATVDASGVVTARGKGTATITAVSSDGTNITAACTVTVTNNAHIVTDPAQLESGHPYDVNCTDFWIYTDEGAESLTITFDAQTEIEMTEKITGQMYLADGTAVGDAKVYSVKAYCDAAIPVYSQYEAFADLVGLLEAMLNYGAYSQIQFGCNTDDLANSNLADTAPPSITAADVNAYAHGATGSEEGISVASVSLLLESTTTIRFYFNLDGAKSIDEYTFYVDGVETTPIESNGQYYVDKVNVAAKDLDEMVTVTIGDLTVKYCGLSYVRQVAVLYPTYYSEALVNVAKALYAYNQAANAYFA